MSILNKVSTKPNPLSFRWHSSISILAYLILNAIYIERIFSLLQWSKYLYRVFVKWSRGNGASIDEKSQRINVPSLLVEVYYLLVATIIVLIALSGWSASLWAYCFAIYLLIDTSVWVLYYFFFRRFFEENYAIMHAVDPVGHAVDAVGHANDKKSAPVIAETLTVNVAFLQITAHAPKMQIPNNQIINFYQRAR